MNRIAYMDGRFCAPQDIRIPLDDRGIYFADAVYDACLGKGRCIFDAPAHLDRLFGNLQQLHIPAPCAPEDLMQLLRQAATACLPSVCFLYIQISRTAPNRRHAYPDNAASRLLITADAIELPGPDEELTLITTEDLRYDFCYIKTVNLLPNVLAAREAQQRGADEAIFVRDGQVTECAHSNIAILKDGVLLTHPTDRRILPGITRRRLLALCETCGIPVCERPFSVREMMEADDVLISSTSKLVRRAAVIDGCPVGGKGPLGRQLCRGLYQAFLDEMKE